MARVLPEPDIRKIAILRANALGDFLFILPAAEALRAGYPRAEIVLLGLDWHREFLEGRPGPIDRVVVVPPFPGVTAEADRAEDPQRLASFFRDMEMERFDLAVQLHGGGRYSNGLVRRLGAKLTIGLRTPDAPPLDRSVPYVYFQHEVVRYLEVVSLVGARSDSLQPRIALTSPDLAEAECVLPSGVHSLVVLHPGATDPRRRWSPERFAAVGDTLSREGARVVVTGTEEECSLVAAVVDAMQQEALNLCGRLSLGGLAGLLSRCRLVVSNDTGPLHLAAAVGTPTVGIFWCFNLVNTAPLTRMHHRPATSWRLDCPVCGVDCTRGSCEHKASFVADVPVEEIVEQALDLLGSA